jgi:hypothetical protein
MEFEEEGGITELHTTKKSWENYKWITVKN